MVFTVDVEDYYHAIVPVQDWKNYGSRVRKNTWFILYVLKKYDVKGMFYFLGIVAKEYPGLVKDVVAEGHMIGSHGMYHQHNDHEGGLSDQQARTFLPQASSFRSPYWDTTKRPGFSGGAFFRILPYQLVKLELFRSKVFWIHPHDVDPRTPYLDFAPFWRYIGVKDSRRKLDRLLEEVPFEDPKDYQYG